MKGSSPAPCPHRLTPAHPRAAEQQPPPAAFMPSLKSHRHSGKGTVVRGPGAGTAGPGLASGRARRPAAKRDEDPSDFQLHIFPNCKEISHHRRSSCSCVGQLPGGRQGQALSSEIFPSFSSPSPLLWFRLSLPPAEMPDVGHKLILWPRAHTARALFLRISPVGEGRKTVPVGLV